MIVIGGITRLTDSGLSMVDWRPLTGMLPPMNSGDWNEFFSQYRETPEFQLVNPTMSIQEFKSIFWMEYLHRIWGRLIGIVYLLPLIFFITKDMIQKKIYTHLLIILVLGFLQGLLGWMMVKSGLIDRPDVSHYRLTAHLMLAILIYTYLFWILLKLYRPDHVSRADYYNRDVMPIKKLSTIILIFILITLASGGLVAGLDAGAIYNTFPLMGNKLIPNEVMILDPWFINFADGDFNGQDGRDLFDISWLCQVWYPTICNYDIAPTDYKNYVADKLSKSIDDFKQYNQITHFYKNQIENLRLDPLPKDKKKDYQLSFIRYNDTQDKHRGKTTWRQLLPRLEKA